MRNALVGDLSINVKQNNLSVECVVCFICLGEFINSAGEEVSRDTASAILQGIATGTFIYVTFFEILQRELGTREPELLKIVMTVLGFVLIALVRMLAHDDHGAH